MPSVLDFAPKTRFGCFVLQTCGTVSHQAADIDRTGAKLELRKADNSWTGTTITAVKL